MMSENIPVPAYQPVKKEVPVKQRPVEKEKARPVNVLSPNPRKRSKDYREVNFY